MFCQMTGLASVLLFRVSLGLTAAVVHLFTASAEDYELALSKESLTVDIRDYLVNTIILQDHEE